MNRTAASAIGLLALLSALPAQAQSSGGGFDLYEHMRDVTHEELSLTTPPDEVLQYIANALPNEELKLTSGDVRSILENGPTVFCAEKEKTYGDCAQIVQTVRDFAKKVTELRTFERDLQFLVSGYETGVTGTPGQPADLSLQIPGLARIWQGDMESLFTPMKAVPLRAVPHGIDDDQFTELENALSSLQSSNAPESGDRFTAAVWRYRNGLATVERGGECEERKSNDELRNFTLKRFCEVEDKLKAIRDALPKDIIPPLKDGEIVLFPPKIFRSLRVIVWMQTERLSAADAGSTGGRTQTEIGLQWEYPLEPVFPSLLSEEAEEDCMTEVGDEGYCDVVDALSVLPGGVYPDPPEEPKDREGACVQGLARRGYLCRKTELESCNDPLKKEPNQIALTNCDPQRFTTPVAVTDSGPDICQRGWWQENPDAQDAGQKDTPDKDPDLRPDTCSSCAVDLYCGTCPKGTEATTFPKDKNGVISVCISTNTPPAALLSIIAHEVTHAQQHCEDHLDVQSEEINEKKETCCAQEHEAYTVSCTIEDEEGILKSAGISREECEAAMANASCEKFGANACSNIDPSVKKRFGEAFKKYVDDHPNAPSCQEIVGDLKNKAPRIWAIEQNLRSVCSPGCKTSYLNTISNNLCYVGECLEQSVEQSRIVPGRLGLVTQDESFPWDSCMRDDPKNGQTILIPAYAPPPPPVYSPLGLVESLDRALCQLNGMPARTPPVLCGFSPLRRLDLPLDNFLQTALSMGAQGNESADAIERLESMEQSLATRLSTDMVTRYFGWAGRSLSDILEAANTLLKQIGETQFPMTMCPRSAAGEENLCATFQQK